MPPSVVTLNIEQGILRAKGLLPLSLFIGSLFMIFILSSSSASATCTPTRASASARGSCSASYWVPGWLALIATGSFSATSRLLEVERCIALLQFQRFAVGEGEGGFFSPCSQQTRNRGL